MAVRTIENVNSWLSTYGWAGFEIDALDLTTRVEIVKSGDDAADAPSIQLPGESYYVHCINMSDRRALAIHQMHPTMPFEMNNILIIVDGIMALRYVW